MSFKSETYRVLIASPSELAEERQAATDVINEWNEQHAVAESVVLLSTKWETHARPQSGIRPQEAINRQIVQDSDILIGMFWTKIGTQTGVAESGTVEEIDQFVGAGKPALLYFSSRPIDPSKIDLEQQNKLRAFKDATYKKAIVGTFNTVDGLRRTLLRDLMSQVRDLKASMPPQSGDKLAEAFYRGPRAGDHSPVATLRDEPKAQDQNRFYPPTVTISPPTLRASLYVCDMRITFADLEKERHSELTMRVFNGTGRVVEFSGLSGHIKFNAPNNTDPARMGNLPTPTLRPDTEHTVAQLQEWFLILTQRVPAVEADKLLAMLNANIPIHFDLSQLTIEVVAQNERKNVERLPIWDGMSYSYGYGFGRIINAVAHLRV